MRNASDPILAENREFYATVFSSKNEIADATRAISFYQNVLVECENFPYFPNSEN
ncbi:4119_t:CDS:2 [Funneliformis geosporum]|uniref:4119_t:CDS:1 n=1 Tax=Funneliformis geosporum TaxID=1117311 RepID=A0A9W4WTU2_9GLOM|nr:4119_t:CDS:2 [Funneliformis geosporum]